VAGVFIPPVGVPVFNIGDSLPSACAFASEQAIHPETYQDRSKQMGFTDAIRSGIQRYTDFSTRSSRSEFWFWQLGIFIGYIALAIIIGILSFIGLGFIGGILYVIFALGIIIPSIAVAVRRLHDVSKSGWWVLISLIPVIGTIILIIWAVTAGHADENEWGANPLG
jgi:uncharacterized membrane protein YhaH (DUF805 family)